MDKIKFCLLIITAMLIIIFAIKHDNEVEKLAFKKCAENNNKIMQVIDACVDRGRGACLRYEKREINLCDYPKDYKYLIVDKI